MEKKKEEAPIRILPPKVDVVFKMIFGDERNKDILVDFLKSILTLSDDEYGQHGKIFVFIMNVFYMKILF